MKIKLFNFVVMLLIAGLNLTSQSNATIPEDAKGKHYTYSGFVITQPPLGNYSTPSGLVVESM